MDVGQSTHLKLFMMRRLLLFTFTFSFSFLITQSQAGIEKKIAKNPVNNQIIYFANGGLTINAAAGNK